MAHEILSVKLYELDKKIGQVHSRIQMSEAASHEQIRATVKKLREECTENELVLRSKLQYSKAAVVAELSEAYNRIEQVIQRQKEKIKNTDDEFSVEEKILFAEYALDFAMQAANQALLVSMEALDAHMSQQEKEETKL